MATQQPKHTARDHREKDWFWANNGVIEWYGEIIGADGIAVYMVLCKHANPAGECWPSYQTIASKLKLSRPTVIKCMKRLEAAGLIAKTDRYQPTKDGGTMPDSNMYLLLAVQPLDEPSKARLLGLVKEIDHPPSKAGLPHLVKEVNHPSKAGLPKQDSLNKTHMNKTQGGSATHSSHPPRQSTLDSFNEAVAIFKELSGKKQISPAIATLIATRVTDMGLWRKTIESWASCGYNVTNIKDMLDWYDHPEKMAAKMGYSNGLGQTQTQGGRMVQRNGHQPANAHLPNRPVSSGQAEFERQYRDWLDSDDESEFVYRAPQL